MSPAIDLLIVADDLTGAADAAAPFAQHGVASTIHLTGSMPTTEVVAVSTESRGLDPAAAGDRVRTRLRQIRAETAVSRLYKKIDSALRGNPATEIIAAMTELELQRAIVAPALPAQGRMTVGGCQLVMGQAPLLSGFESAENDLVALFGAWSQVEHIDLATVRTGPAGLAAALGRSAARVLVVDAESDGDLDLLAVAVWSVPGLLLAGSAGFAAALARSRRLDAARTWRRPVPRTPVLSFIASRHPATGEQLARARAHGIRIVPLDLDDPFGTARVAAAEVDAGHDVIVVGPEEAVVREALLGAIGRAAVESAGSIGPGGLLLSGGDVAAAVCAATGAEQICLTGELLPAIPWGVLRGGRYDGCAVATKAGSFGNPTTIVELIALLNGERGGNQS